MAGLGLALWLTGCGGGGTQSDSIGLVGFLRDSAVEGSHYFGSLGSSGKTDAQGRFLFQKGETLTFTLGKMPLGSVTLPQSADGSVITPVELVKGSLQAEYSAEDINDARVTALLQVLQTADENQDPEDGIQISEMAAQQIDLALGDTAVVSADPQAVAEALGRQLVSKDAAVAHFEKTVKELGREQVTAELQNDDSKSSVSESEMSSSGNNVSESSSSETEGDSKEQKSENSSSSSVGTEAKSESSNSSEIEAGEDSELPVSTETDETYQSSKSSDTSSSETDDDQEQTKSESSSSSKADDASASSESSKSSEWSESSSSSSSSSSQGTGDFAASGAYTLLAWNDLGMHCMDGRDFSVFSILPPYNTLNAQLIKKAGTSNKHVSSGVTITYKAAPSLSGKYNTTNLLDSANNPKTNFWDFVGTLFGTVPAPDRGLTGNHTPEMTEHALAYNTDHRWWEATGLPITPYNDDGSKNYYPMVDVTAKDASGNLLATTRVVLPVSDEMDCRACHGSTSGYADAKPATGWENDADAEKDFKYNILRLHDEKFPTAVSDHQAALKAAGYNGYGDAGLYASAKNGNPVLCATCHASNALPGTGIAGIKPLTESLHSLHANVTDPTNGQTLNASTNRSACYRCHPGATTKCLRGAMGKQSDIQCQSCHGSMSAVGAHGRKGWLDEPNCQACHQDGKRYTTAVTNAQAGTLRAALDTRFSTNPNTPSTGVSLYHYSTGHGKMQCSACHGSTHAIYPSSHEEDNLQSIAVQGHSGTIAECTACHDTVPNTISGGPHGMHSVGQYWVNEHKHEAEHNRAQCKSCHGSDYRGSVLSKTFSARSFKTESGTENFVAGHEVSCYDCHNGPSGD